MSGILGRLLGNAAAAAASSFFNLVTLLLNTTSTNGAQNNTFLDTSSIGNTVTRNGTPTQGTFTPFSQTGWSNNFNGSNAYLSLAASTDWQWPSTSWTVEMWVYNITNTNYTGRTAPIQIQNGSATADINDWSFGTDGNGKASFYYWIGSGPESVVGSTTIPLNTWTHVAATYDGTSVIKIYVNGVLDATGAKTGTPTTSTKNLIIGAGNGAYYNGYISNLRRVVGSVVYTSNFTPSTTPLTAITNTQILTCQSNRFIDNSVNVYPLTIGGTPSVQAFSPFLPTTSYDPLVVGGSGLFVRANSDILTLPNNSLLVGSSDFSLETWVYQFDRSGSMNFFGNQTNRSTAAGSSWNIAFTNTNGYVESTTWVGGTPYNLLSPTAPDLNAWNYIVWCRTGSTQSIFVNGVRVATSSAIGGGTVNDGSTTYPPAIGANGGSASDILNGYLSGFKIIIGSGGYDATASTLTVPTAPPTNTTNTKLLTNFTNAGIYDSAAKNNALTVGNAQVSTTQAKFGTTSMGFDGTGDNLKVKLTNAIGSGDYTIEGFFYASGTGIQYLFDIRESSQYIGAYIIGSSTTLYVNFGTTLDIVASSSFALNTWNHMAFVRSGSGANNTSVYLNGSRVYQRTDTTNYSIVPNLFVACENSGNYYLNGYVDEFRITKGYAVYSGATYTVPTAAFPLL